MKSSIFFGLIIALLIFINAKTESLSVGRPGPQAIVYKTKGDYAQLVPVTLSEDKSRIISYPAPQDVFTNGKLALPTHLAHGYLLDNRGISPNSAFIKMTYEEYSQMAQSPSPEELYKMIIDKSPFTEMYDLGARSNFKSDKDICTMVKKHKLKDYKKLI